MVHLDGRFAELAMATQAITARDLEHMLWDRLLAHLLGCSGKSFFIDKTPSNVRIWDRLIECWPDARFIALRRNPAAIVASIMDNGHERQRAIAVVEEAISDLNRATDGIADLHMVSYESLTESTEDCLRDICEFLGVEFEPQMIEYGQQSHGPFVYGIGDWSDNIQSGKIEPSRAVSVPGEPTLLELCRMWGYFLGAANPVGVGKSDDCRQGSITE